MDRITVRSLALALWLGLALITGPVFAQRTARTDPSPGPSPVRTILLVGEATTWLQTPGPPYEVGITLKMKLEEAGFRVTFDPNQAFDAVLEVLYRETPGREYRALEQGTTITCDLHFDHPTAGRLREYHLEASTPWPEPHGSLYWEAVRGLEENPYYYFLGDLLQGWVTQQEESATVFSRMLQRLPLTHPRESGDSTQATARVVANAGARVNAIRELGRLRMDDTAPALWRLIDDGTPRERHAALAAIGEWGDPASLPRLRAYHARLSDPETQAAVAAAIVLIEQAARPPQ